MNFPHFISDMNPMVTLFLVTLLCGVVIGFAISQDVAKSEPETDLNDLSDFNLNTKPSSSAQAYLNWMRYVLSNVKHQIPERRSANYDVPMAVLDQRPTRQAAQKRNGNGIWIWMPAQGYVSVPKHQQGLQGADGEKPGKIMRYGRK